MTVSKTVVSSSNLGRRAIYASLAQWLELLFCKQGVVGSSPTWSSILISIQLNGQSIRLIRERLQVRVPLWILLYRVAIQRERLPALEAGLLQVRLLSTLLFYLGRQLSWLKRCTCNAEDWVRVPPCPLQNASIAQW